MTDFQDLTFYLEGKKMIFSHIMQLDTGGYVGEITESYSTTDYEASDIKTYSRLGNTVRNAPLGAFIDIITAVKVMCDSSGLSVIKVNNPCNCPLVEADIQCAHLKGISITVNDPPFHAQ